MRYYLRIPHNIVIMEEKSNEILDYILEFVKTVFVEH